MKVYNFLFNLCQCGAPVVTRRNLTSKIMSPIKTFVFFDLETTGLPHLEHNSTKITELCAITVQADHIELGCFPRVHNKLSLCFNPGKLISPESTNITGLSNDLLEYQSYFSSDVVDVIKKWLDMSQEPICLVAHNGNRFDYPIFRAEIEKTGNSLPDSILCVDSLVAFRTLDKNKETVTKPSSEVPFEFDDDFDAILTQACDEYENQAKHVQSPAEVQKINETTPKKQIISSKASSVRGKSAINIHKRSFGHVRESVSYKLEDVYTRLTSKAPTKAHEAEADVVMLICCAATYGEKFVEYANANAVKLSDIPMMKPGKRVGL